MKFKTKRIALLMMGLTLGMQGNVIAADEKIAVFTKNQTNPFFQAFRLGADSAAKQMGASTTHKNSHLPSGIRLQRFPISFRTAPSKF